MRFRLKATTIFCAFRLTLVTMVWCGTIPALYSEDNIQQHFADAIADAPVWSSKEGPNSFYFEICRSNHVAPVSDSQRGLERIMCDHRDGTKVILRVKNFQPVFTGTSLNCFQLSNSRWTPVRMGWNVQARNDSLDSILTMSESHQSTMIEVDIPGFFKLENTAQSALTYSPVTRSFVVTNVNKTKTVLRERSPNDQKMLGCRIGEVVLADDPKGQNTFLDRLSLRAFVTVERGMAGVRLRDPGQKMKSLLLETATIRDPMSAWNSVAPDSTDRIRGEVRSTQAAMHRCMILLVRDGGDVKKSIAGPLETLTEGIRHGQYLTLLPFQQHTAIGIDDPAVRWRRFERSYFEILPELTAGLLVVLFQSADRVNKDALYSCLDAIADIGSPGCGFEDAVPINFLVENTTENPLVITAILRSRYMYEVTSAEKEAMLEFLMTSTPGSRCERVACETLLRLDCHASIPGDALNRWWEKEIVEAEAVQRWDHISMLSFHREGRRLLMDRIATSKPPLAHLLWENLRQRADATSKLKRFDFMSTEECQEILRLPEPPVAGRDTESGVARPFPKDEAVD